MKNSLLILVFLSPAFILSQTVQFPPITGLTFTDFLIEETSLNGKIKYFNKPTGDPLDGKYIIYETEYRYEYDIADYYDTGLKFIGTFKKGYKDGFWEVKFENKRVKTIRYNNGLVVGDYRVYNIEGELLYKTYFGKYGNGTYKDFFYETGVLKEEGDYKNGIKEGNWCEYHENGDLKKISFYESGILTD